MSNTPPQPDEDGLYPIRAVSQMTGVNPITLRAWERRYSLIRPLRTDSGHRLYSQRDVDRILRILALNEQGIALAQVGRVLDNEQTEGAPEPALARMPASRESASLEQSLATAIERMSDDQLQTFYRQALAWLPPGRILRDWLLPACEARAGQRLQSAQDELRALWIHEQTLQRAQGWLDASYAQAGTRPVLIGTLLPGHDGLPALALAIRLGESGLPVRLFATPTGLEPLLTGLSQWHCRALVLAAPSRLPPSVIGPHRDRLEKLGNKLFLLSKEDHGDLFPDNVRALSGNEEDLPKRIGG